MVKKLVSKSEFSRMAGVSPSAVTKALRGFLGASLDGKRVDTEHPTAVKYLQDKADAPTILDAEPAAGIDPLYDSAVIACSDSGRYTANFISKSLNIGVARANKILSMMELAGTDSPDFKPKVKKRANNGYTAVNDNKKQEALAIINTGTVIHEVPEDIKTFADMTLSELIQRFGTDSAFVDWLKATKSIEDINEKRLKNAQTKGELVSRELIKVGVIDPINTAMQRLLTDGAKTLARRVVAMNQAGRSVEDCEKFIINQISSFIAPMKAKIKRNYKKCQS